jgi:prepilin-type N-terminal cleavage/methylation domain-containing protein
LIVIGKYRVRGWNAGFTLVEVLIAVFLLAIGTLALTSSVTYTKRLQTEAVEINEATEISNAILESFRKMPYIVLSDGLPSGIYKVADLGVVYDKKADPFDLIDPGLMNQINWRLDYRRLVESVRIEEGQDAMRVTVEIRRQEDPEGRPIVKMSTFITMNGINFR